MQRSLSPQNTYEKGLKDTLTSEVLLSSVSSRVWHGKFMRGAKKTDRQRITASLIALVGASVLGSFWWATAGAWAGLGILSLGSSLSLAYNRLSRDVTLPCWQLGIILLYGWFFVFAPTVSLLIEGESVVPGDEVGWGFIYAAAGVMCFWSGARLGKRLFAVRGSPRLSRVAVAARTLGQFDTWVAITFTGIAATVWSFQYGYTGLLTADETVGPWAGAISTLSQLMGISMCIAWCRTFELTRGQDIRSARAWRFCAIAMCLFGAVRGLVINSKAGIVEPLVIAAVSYLAVYGRIPRKAVAMAVLIYCFVSFPFIVGLRSVQWEWSDLSRGQYAREAVGYFVEGQWFGAGSDFSSGVVSLGRGVFMTFTDVVNSAGQSIAFLDGETFTRGIQALVPQAIWRSKTQASIGNYVGVLLGQVDSRDQRTNIAVTQMGEWCLNFGITGVCAGMLLWGLAAGFVDFRIGERWGLWLRAWLFLAIRWQEGYIGQTVTPFVKEVVAIGGVIAVLGLLRKIVVKGSGEIVATRPRDRETASAMLGVGARRSRGGRRNW